MCLPLDCYDDDDEGDDTGAGGAGNGGDVSNELVVTLSSKSSSSLRAELDNTGDGLQLLCVADRLDAAARVGKDHVARYGKQHPPEVDDADEEMCGIPCRDDNNDHDDPPDPPTRPPRQGTPPSTRSTPIFSLDAGLPPSGRITLQRDSPGSASSDTSGHLA